MINLAEILKDYPCGTKLYSPKGLVLEAPEGMYEIV